MGSENYAKTCKKYNFCHLEPIPTQMTIISNNK